MRRILLAALALLLLAMPVHAQEAAEPDVTFGAEKLEHALDEETREAYRARSPGQVSRSGPRWFQPERCSRRRCCARLHPARRRQMP